MTWSALAGSFSGVCPLFRSARNESRNRYYSSLLDTLARQNKKQFHITFVSVQIFFVVQKENRKIEQIVKKKFQSLRPWWILALREIRSLFLEIFLQFSIVKTVKFLRFRKAEWSSYTVLFARRFFLVRISPETGNRNILRFR